MTDDSELQLPSSIKLFLEEQKVVFTEPTSLPPLRSHSHKITLISDASPVNSRLYRHSAI